MRGGGGRGFTVESGHVRKVPLVCPNGLATICERKGRVKTNFKMFGLSKFVLVHGRCGKISLG